MGAKLGGGGGKKYDLGQNSEINVTPFVDVMLVLLIIFMVTAPLITTGVVDLPTVGQASQRPPKVIEVVVGPDERLKLRVDGAEPAPVPLVGEGGVDAAVAHHVLATLQCRLDDLGHVLGTVCRHEECLGARRHVGVLRVGEDPAQQAADSGAAGFPRGDRLSG